MLGDVPELLPACGCFGVEGCGVGVVAGVLGELGAGGAEGVLVERVAGLEPVGEPLGEVGVAGGERGPQHRRELSGVVGDVTRAGRLLDLGEERACLVGCAGGEPGGGGGREHLDGRVWRGLRARCLDEPVGDAGRALGLAAGEVGRQLERAHPDQARMFAPLASTAAASRAGPFERLLGAAELDEQARAVGLELSPPASVRPRCSQKAIPCSKAASERAGPWSG